MVNSFNFSKYSSATPSIDMELQPERYFERIFHLVLDIFLHNRVFVFSLGYFVDSQTRHVVYLRNFLQGCKHVANEKPIFQFM